MPFYESEEDRAREEAVAMELARLMGCQQAKYPGDVAVDRVFSMAGRAFCYAEVKWRWNESTRYQTYLIDWDKLVNGLALARKDGMPLVLAVHFTDGIFTWYVNGIEKLTVKPGGRYDRDDPYDRDMCAHIPMGEFTRITVLS